MGLMVANALSLATCVVGNTVAHARFTLSGPRRMYWQEAVAGGLLVFAVTLPCTMAALGATELLGLTTATAQLLALLFGSAVAAFVRFVVGRAWSFRDHVRARAA